MTILRVILYVLLALVLLAGGYLGYMRWIGNARVERELMERPDGERAGQVMLLTLPGGRRIPVNYLREGDRIYAGADGRWWRELVGKGVPVRVLVRGEALEGNARAVLDDPAYTKDVFSRLRPNALEGFGTLVEIRLEAEGGD